jgi:hypothetical protein
MYIRKRKRLTPIYKKTHTHSPTPDSRNLDSRIPDSRNSRAGMKERKQKRKQTMNPCIRKRKRKRGRGRGRERERETIAMTLVIANSQ